jgi:Subtilase family
MRKHEAWGLLVKWYLEENGDHHPAGHGDDGAAPGLDAVPAAILQRHGARVLSPPDAAAVAGWPAPRSTVYRARTLLAPASVLAGEPLREINDILGQAGLSLVVPAPARAAAPAAVAAGAGPLRSAVLVPAAAQDGHPPRPVVVDAWVALQVLRAAVTARERRGLDRAAVSQLSLEHLLVGSAITGSPASDGGGVTGSPASDGGGVTGPGSASSYLYGGCDGRTPVEVCASAPPRQPDDLAASRHGRRPVVAVLDTGVREHPWLDVAADPAAPGGYATTPAGFVTVDQGLQDLLYAHGQQLAAAGDQPRHLLRYPWDRPVTADPLIGELDTHTGHGTFIAGIVRQVAPDARVLSLRIMHSDGIVYEGDLLYALSLLAARVTHGEQVDVVSLSLGYFSETPADQAYGFALWQVIKPLLELGVVVTAAAGNYATSRRFYPAAFAELAAPAGAVPVISVAALNPNGSKALFSDGGYWIRAWAPGAAMLSNFPADINGSRDPQVSLPAHPGNPAPPGRHGERAALDPDDFRSGFALWSGTSFAAPYLAAQLARELLGGAAAGGEMRLDQAGQAAAGNRVRHALKNLGWPG